MTLSSFSGRNRAVGNDRTAGLGMGRLLLFGGLLLVVVPALCLAQGQTRVGEGTAAVAGPGQQQQTLDEEQLVQRVKEEVMKELLQGGTLQKQIDLGIRRFVEEQRAAVKAAREQAAAARAKKVRPVSVQRDHIYGNPQAEISLIEYSDFECPYCKRFHDVAKRLVDTSNGRVNWVYRHFPLSMHDPGAEREAIASECASTLGGNQAFWKYADAIFARTTSNGNGFPASELVPLAKEIGLDPGKFQHCLGMKAPKERVAEDHREGTEIGIDGTPTNVLVNHKTKDIKVIPGAVPLVALQSDVKQMLQ